MVRIAIRCRFTTTRHANLALPSSRSREVNDPLGSHMRRFEIILIRPSHYDDDGYVIQWFRSIMPSNSLAVVNGLAKDAAERRVLGPDVDIHVTSMDEANTRIKPEALI